MTDGPAPVPVPASGPGLDAIRYAVADPSAPPAGLLELLCAAFAEPPYEDVPALMAKRVASWPDFARSNGFRVVTAYLGDELVGVCFGFVELGF